jgi:pimeloyl-ACP methyl ester carboxylesterase
MPADAAAEDIDVALEQLIEGDDLVPAIWLERPAMRDTVLGIVDRELRRVVPDGGDVVVVGHSLGSIVAYDALTRLPDRYRVRLLVTAGSPLGYPVVQKTCWASRTAGRPRCRPACRAPPAAG